MLCGGAARIRTVESVMIDCGAQWVVFGECAKRHRADFGHWLFSTGVKSYSGALIEVPTTRRVKPVDNMRRLQGRVTTCQSGSAHRRLVCCQLGFIAARIRYANWETLFLGPVELPV